MSQLLRNLSDRAIHSKCQVILYNFSNTPLPSAISSRGWASLCKKPSRCPDVFIKEFYFNMHVINTSMPSFITVFRATHIVVTRNSFSRYYMSLWWIIQITLVILVSLPSLVTSWPHSSMRRPCCGEVHLISPQLSSLRDHGSLIW